jgi:methanogenic corrinoid protein MtbC1
LIGGGPLTQKWADEIGADGYAKDAEDAVSVAMIFMAKKQKRQGGYG